ncbi:MAG: Tad domain-containing protein, partial [Pseudomonadota bacterium]
MARSERGSITIQVVIMSILLLGALGLVIDSGRLYATHSQMQAYADQVALAAANELDGEDDAIHRATQAAFGLTVGADGFLSAKTSGGADIWVRELVFWSDLRENFGLQHDLSNSRAASGFRYVENDDGVVERVTDSEGSLQIFAAGGVDNTAEADVQSSARYVTVVINQHTQLTLSDFFNGIRNAFRSEKDSIGMRVAANATAGLERVSCDRLSTLVFCNPWEDTGIDI